MRDRAIGVMLKMMAEAMMIPQHTSRAFGDFSSAFIIFTLMAMLKLNIGSLSLLRNELENRNPDSANYRGFAFFCLLDVSSVSAR